MCSRTCISNSSCDVPIPGPPIVGAGKASRRLRGPRGWTRSASRATSRSAHSPALRSLLSESPGDGTGRVGCVPSRHSRLECVLRSPAGCVPRLSISRSLIGGFGCTCQRPRKRSIGEPPPVIECHGRGSAIGAASRRWARHRPQCRRPRRCGGCSGRQGSRTHPGRGTASRPIPPTGSQCPSSSARRVQWR